MRLTEPSQIKIGMTIYAVHALRSFTDITELVLLSDAYKYKVNDRYTTDAADINPTGLCNSRLFLRDFNCGGHHNNHGLFSTRADADQYVEDFKNGIIHMVESESDTTGKLTQNDLF